MTKTERGRCGLIWAFVLSVALTGDIDGLLAAHGGGQCTQSARTYPSIFQPWNGIENLPDEEPVHRLARHDLIFTGRGFFGLKWKTSSEQPYPGHSTQLVNPQGRSTFLAGRRKRAELLQRNPCMKILCELRYRENRYDDLPPDSTFWLRDKNGDVAPGWGDDTDGDGKVERDEVRFMLVDFTKERVQDLLAQKALALKRRGLFDGIMLDWWKEGHATSGRWPNWNGTVLTPAEETRARLNILKKIRAQVGDEFLILVNSNDSKVPRSAPYVNGLFMECYRPAYDKNYTHQQLMKIENTLLWAENNLKEPHINCLEGWRIVTDYDGDVQTRVKERNSEKNKQWMRFFTTLSLTHSNGYVVFSDHNAQPVRDHLHNWYAFWNSDLGRPVGNRGVTYRGVDGLFIREFERGWAVCNRSGSPQTVSFEKAVTSVPGEQTKTSHHLGNLDGQVFLK